MKLIRKTKSEKINQNYYVYYGIFLCPYCLQEVEKPLSDGYKCKSCGCQTNKKHGGSYTKLYSIWLQMKQRCLNLKNHSYKDYGGRGITICPEWTDKLNGYINFRNWALSNEYKENLEINRIDNNKEYSPKNCNFIIHKENMRNVRGIKLSLELANEIRYLYNKGEYTQKELGIIYKVSKIHINNIINNKYWVK